jgi:hypothetical protein
VHARIDEWIPEYTVDGKLWCAKRLSGNDTLANGSHQAGPYIPKQILFFYIPELEDENRLNPDAKVRVNVDSHDEIHQARAIWYNNKLFGKTRNEARMTGFGGSSSSLLDPENTGALAVFIFTDPASMDSDSEPSCHVWICGTPEEEAVLEDIVGPVEPKEIVLWSRDNSAQKFTRSIRSRKSTPCWLAKGKIPDEWLESLPDGNSIIRKTLELRPGNNLDVDKRLLERRKCEFDLFRSVEEAFYSDRISAGFDNVDSFIKLANTVLQSRKARSGKSLEYHTLEILREEGFKEGVDFQHNAVIENGKRPDFIFPSASAYEDGSLPDSRFRMLGAKTTCRDRWRQVLNEASRIKTKHLLTLQEGVSESQFAEMKNAGLKLVVPLSLHRSFPKSIKSELLSLSDFLVELRTLS